MLIGFVLPLAFVVMVARLARMRGHDPIVWGGIAGGASLVSSFIVFLLASGSESDGPSVYVAIFAPVAAIGACAFVTLLMYRVEPPRREMPTARVPSWPRETREPAGAHSYRAMEPARAVDSAWVELRPDRCVVRRVGKPDEFVAYRSLTDVRQDGAEVLLEWFDEWGKRASCRAAADPPTPDGAKRLAKRINGMRPND